MIKVFNNMLTNDIVSFEQLGPVFDFWLKPIFTTIEISKFRRQKSPIQKLGWKD